MQKVTPKEETALSVVLSFRSYRSSPVVKTPAPIKETKSFRDRFCESLEREPVAALAPVPAPTPIAEVTTTASGIKDIGIQTERFQPTLIATPKEPVYSSKTPRTLKDSRWASDDAKVVCQPKPLKSSRWAGHDRTDTTSRTNTNKQFQGKKPFRGNHTQFNSSKTLKDSRWAKHEEKEAPSEPPRVNFDWEEFEREVKENNLKTLKDSRWA
ncbi:hypothetical protein F4801DRAFT_556317 [Xylaria longipes]|nr:hypothetical protein F4801DRAFT_556317 [Xylaria longipes]RYC57456.1 hypothetical protein CHU98_g8757 [Xylaria longipes]